MESFRSCGRHVALRKTTLLLWVVATGTIIIVGYYHLTRKQPEVRYVAGVSSVSSVSSVAGLKADSSQFTLNGKAIRIFGGSIHYFRVPRAYWEDRLLKLKACGLNTLTTYVPWNLHEPERGVFNYGDDLDLEAYLSLAASLGLWVILRPGPYICSEWDLGGLPSWLLRDPNMKLRTTYPGFRDAVDDFFDDLIPRVVPYQYSKGGPIIAVQVENEYGSYIQDDEYMPFIKEALLSRGIAELLMTSDNRGGIMSGAVEGALGTLNFQKLSPYHIKYLDELQPQRPKMVMEFWCGWFDVWGGPHRVYAALDVRAEVRRLVRLNISVNLYMFHGGTNFGFMSGALASEKSGSLPMVTSYDYDAPLSESGDYTTKYHLLRNVFRVYYTEALPLLPPLQPGDEHRPVDVLRHLSLWDSLHYTDEPLISERPVNMENLPVNGNNGQSYGYTLYETTIAGGGTLHSKDSVRDRALVFVARSFVGVLDYKTREVSIPEEEGKRTLSLLVENHGRVNYGLSLDDQRKGLVGDIELNQQVLRDFTIYSLDMKAGFMNRLDDSALWTSAGQQPSFPGFFGATLHVDGVPRDTFITLPGWSKGVVFINGKNLGRYWSIGPQQTLYLPGPWLQTGLNQVIVFEEQRAGGKVQFASSPDYGQPDSVL